MGEGERAAGKPPCPAAVISLPDYDWLARLLGYFLGPLQLRTLGCSGTLGVLEHGENTLGMDILCQQQRVPWPALGGAGRARALTSADALLLPRQDAWAVDDADALQDLIGQLGAHESGRKRSKVGSEQHCRVCQRRSSLAFLGC